MNQYLAKRLLLFVPTLLLVTFIVFVVMWIIPGDPALFILSGGSEGTSLNVPQEQLDKLRSELGLDRPLYIRYADWVWDLARGDLGDSIWYKIPVTDELKHRIPITLQLTVMAMLIAFAIAVPLGVLSAVNQDTWVDHSARIFTIVGIASPTFWIGILVVYGLSYGFDWLPPLGYADLWEDPLTNLEQMIFPALVLAFHDLALTARVTRSAMLEVMREDYIRTARAKGLPQTIIIGRHALKNALLVPLTTSGWQFGRLLGGTVVIEAIFLIPGMGSFLIDSMFHRDFVVIQAIVVLVGLMVLSLNLIIDLLYGVLDPRIHYA